MIDCLKDFISLRNLCDQTNSQNVSLWMDDMPDSGIVKMEWLSDRTSRDGIGLWEKIYSRAQSVFVSDIRKWMGKKWQNQDILNNSQSGYLDDDMITVSGAAEYSGIFITCWGSKNTELVINAMRFQLQTAGTIPVKIFDLQTGEELFSDVFTGVVGYNQFPLNYRLPLWETKRKIFVCWDRTGIDSYSFKVHGSGGCKPCDTGGQSTIHAAKIATGVPVLESSLTETTQADGVAVVYSISCSLSQWVCHHKDALGPALRLRAYLELIQEALDNDSLTNRYTLPPAEKLQERYTRYMTTYTDELTGILNSLNLTDDPVCFECGSPVQIQYSIP